MDKQLVDILKKQHYQIVDLGSGIMCIKTICDKGNTQVYLLIAFVVFLILITGVILYYALSIISLIALFYIWYNYGVYFIHGIVFDKEITFDRAAQAIEISYTKSNFKIFTVRKKMNEIIAIKPKLSRVRSGSDFSPFSVEYFVTFHIVLEKCLFSLPFLTLSSENEDKVYDYQSKFSRYFRTWMSEKFN